MKTVVMNIDSLIDPQLLHPSQLRKLENNGPVLLSCPVKVSSLVNYIGLVTITRHFPFSWKTLAYGVVYMFTFTFVLVQRFDEALTNCEFNVWIYSHIPPLTNYFGH